MRLKEKISIGDGGNKLLAKRIRGHANFAGALLAGRMRAGGGSGPPRPHGSALPPPARTLAHPR
jgi:hypothetical protein